MGDLQCGLRLRRRWGVAVGGLICDPGRRTVRLWGFAVGGLQCGLGLRRHWGVSRLVSHRRGPRGRCARRVSIRKDMQHIPWKERSQGRARHLKTGGRGEEGSSTPRRAAGDAAGEAHRGHRRAACLAARDGVLEQVESLILRTRACGGSAKRLHVYDFWHDFGVTLF